MWHSTALASILGDWIATLTAVFSALYRRPSSSTSTHATLAHLSAAIFDNMHEVARDETAVDASLLLWFVLPLLENFLYRTNLLDKPTWLLFIKYVRYRLSMIFLLNLTMIKILIVIQQNDIGWFSINLV